MFIIRLSKKIFLFSILAAFVSQVYSAHGLRSGSKSLTSQSNTEVVRIIQQSLEQKLASIFNDVSTEEARQTFLHIYCAANAAVKKSNHQGLQVLALLPQQAQGKSKKFSCVSAIMQEPDKSCFVGIISSVKNFSMKQETKAHQERLSLINCDSWVFLKHGANVHPHVFLYQPIFPMREIVFMPSLSSGRKIPPAQTSESKNVLDSRIYISIDGVCKALANEKQLSWLRFMCSQKGDMISTPPSKDRLLEMYLQKFSKLNNL